MNESSQPAPVAVQPVGYYEGSATEQSLCAMMWRVAILCILVGSVVAILQFITAYTLATLTSSGGNFRAFTVTAAMKGIASLMLVVGGLRRG